MHIDPGVLAGFHTEGGALGYPQEFNIVQHNVKYYGYIG